MEERCYKSNPFFQIVSVILRIILVLILGWLVLGWIYGKVTPLTFRILFLGATIYSSIVTFYFQSIKVTLCDDYILVKRRNVEETYHYCNYSVRFIEDHTSNGMLAQVSALYRIKLISNYGDVEEVICYSFSKGKFMELKRNLSHIYEEMEEWK